jgi:Cyclic nucleotide-binding domain/Ion transport protein
MKKNPIKQIKLVPTKLSSPKRKTGLPRDASEMNPVLMTPPPVKKLVHKYQTPVAQKSGTDSLRDASGAVIEIGSVETKGTGNANERLAKQTVPQRIDNNNKRRVTVKMKQFEEQSLQKQGTELFNEQTSLMMGNDMQDSKEEFEENLAWRINPEGRFKTFWETTKFFLLIFLFLYLPVKVSFIEEYYLGLYLGEKAIDLFFLFDVIFTFFTPVYVKVELVTTLPDIGKNYLTGWFAADLISLIPIEDILSTQEDLPDTLQFIAKFSKIFRLLRLIKLLRLFRAFDFTNQDNYFLKLMNDNFRGTMVALLLPNMILMTFTIHFFSCCWYLLPDFDETNTNWIIINDFSREGLFDLYIISFYFVIQSVTTCGYGDIASKLNSEIIFRIIVMTTGVFLYGIFSGRIIDYRSELMTHEEIRVKKMQALERICNNYELGEKVYRSIEEKIFDQSKQLKDRPIDFSNLANEDLDRFDYHKFMSQFSGKRFFTKSTERKKFVVNLGRLLKKKVYSQDEVIYNKGDPPLYFYIILKGRISVMTKQTDSVPLMEIRNGYFGEYELLFSEPRKHTLIATTDCELYVLERIDFRKFILTHPETKIVGSSLKEQFELAAIIRCKLLERLQADFDFFVRRKIFWKLVLKDVRKNESTLLSKSRGKKTLKIWQLNN